jgi:hypothetical protein
VRAKIFPLEASTKSMETVAGSAIAVP